MIARILMAWSLVAVTVTIHAAGFAIAFRSVCRSTIQVSPRFWPITWLVIRVAWWLILIHMIEIAVWALFFWWQGCLPDIESAFYFAGVTYATLGYGDLVLPNDWRLFGPLEGLTGILMCGLSTGFFFAVVNKIHGAWAASRQDAPFKPVIR